MVTIARCLRWIRETLGEGRSLKGCHATAQGNALGFSPADAAEALKGRHGVCGFVRYRPFRACGNALPARVPGRCPGLSDASPSGSCVGRVSNPVRPAQTSEVCESSEVLGCGTGWRPVLRTGRRAMTLIELLVVVSIMMLLVLIAVPRMRPGLEERRIREAARSVNVYLSSARSRAIENQRPFGVAILRDANSPLSGVSLIQVEVPVPYAGDVAGAAMRLMNATPSASFPNRTVLRAQIHSGDVSPGLMRWGDLVQFGYQGPLYRIVDDTADNTPSGASYPTATDVGADFPLNPTDLTRGFIDFSVGTVDGSGWITDRWLTLVAEGAQMYNVPWATTWPPTASPPVPFVVCRQPVPSSVAPLQLPRNTVLDLWYSGTASTPFSNTTTTSTSTPITTILFNSTGAVDQVAAHNLGGSIRALEPIYLMVGRRDRVNPDVTDTVTYTEQGVAIPQPRPVAEDGRTNLADLTNLWVAVNPQTGYVTCAEMANGLTTDDHGNEFFYLPLSRQFAREFQSMGGR